MLDALLEKIRPYLGDPSKGLQEELFLFTSQLTPMVNVDLLIKNSEGATLLTWREDEFYGPGWHIPGGIIRFKESVEQRISEVAENEIGAEVKANVQPSLVSEIMHPDRNVRGHFISLLYECSLISGPRVDLRHTSDKEPKNGEWSWFLETPSNLIHQHHIYENWI